MCLLDTTHNIFWNVVKISICMQNGNALKIMKRLLLAIQSEGRSMNIIL